MAFDHPLEADRVDDLNLFTTFVRAPVIGTLMWILGGDHARKKDEEEQKMRDDQLLGDSMAESKQEDDGCSECADYDFSRRQQDQFTVACNSLKNPSLKRGPPNLLGSDLSEFHGWSDEKEAMNHSESSSSGTLKNCKKELSWSDQSGQDLVNYVNESVKHEPNPSLAPPKSAMSRSRSVRANANQMDDLHGEARYLPKGLTSANIGGVIMPTFSYGASASAASGVESPQWGWYINTTPPTPDMYSNRKPPVKQVSLGDASLISTTTEASDFSFDPCTMAPPNRVFQAIQHKNKASPMGCPGVPF